MASTVIASTLKVIVKEEITLNGNRYDDSQEKRIPNINMINKRVVRTNGTNVTTLLTFGATPAAGTHIAGDVKYIRVTNLDNTNFVTLGIKDDGAKTSYFKLESGQTMVFYNTSLDANTNAAVVTTFSTIDTMQAQADTAAVDLEVFVASSQS